VARNYQRAKVLIATEEVKVQSARSALAHASDQLSYQAHHDSLTGLLNRTALMENLDEAMKDSEGGAVTIFFCDLDRFKVVNDSLGHSIGDELLIEAANRLVKTIGEDGYVGRFGGDEFVVVCRGLEDSNAALRIAERISRALSKPFDMRGEDAFIGVSIGIASSRPDITAQQLLRDADVAMYRAKGAPGNHIEFFDAAGDMFSYRFNTETALRKALKSNQFLLHWQPIVNLKNSQVHTLEALVRWDRPGTGILLPKDFMAIAEESGLIVELGRWVIAAACSAGALTDDRSVAVNISVRQLRDVRFVDDLRDILNESGLPPERLILEVTEHSVIDTAIVTAPLSRVRELGVRVALDDFGTGYSSLALLPKLPVDIVKLDRAFMKEIVNSEPTQAVVKSIVQLTSALNVMLIVEGVESDAQRKLLRSLGVQHGQGYWFGQPEPGRLVGSHAEI
jgi:diguanylate cyclase (GGDEF)-like protein